MGMQASERTAATRVGESRIVLPLLWLHYKATKPANWGQDSRLMFSRATNKKWRDRHRDYQQRWFGHRADSPVELRVEVRIDQRVVVEVDQVVVVEVAIGPAGEMIVEAVVDARV